MAVGWGSQTWGAGSWGNLADTTVTLTSVSASFTIGEEIVFADATVSVTGLSSTTFLGTPTTVSTAIVTPTSVQANTLVDSTVFNETVELSGVSIGESGWGRGGWGAGSWGEAVAGISLGTPTLKLGVGIDATSLTSDFDIGNYSITGTSNHNPVGAHAQVFLDDVVVESSATVAVTGIEMDFVDGGADATGDALVTPTGVSATLVENSDGIDIVSSVVFSVTGVSSTFTTGTLDQASIYPVTGIELDFDTGDETIIGNANVSVTGNSMVISLGNIRSTPWANVNPDVSNNFTEVNPNAANNWTEVAA